MRKRKDDKLAKLFEDFKETAEPIDPEGKEEALGRFEEARKQEDARAGETWRERQDRDNKGGKRGR